MEEATFEGPSERARERILRFFPRGSGEEVG
jgi:hypothetical protein